MNCPICQTPIPEDGSVCPNCGNVPAQAEPTTPEVVQKAENFATGLVGALLGAVLGGASIVLLNQLGFVASVSGFILAVCTLKGYELLGGRLMKKGIILSLILIALTPYIADRISWAIVIVQQFPEVSIGEAFQTVHETIELNNLQGDYIKDLLFLYGFTVLGAFSTIRGLFKK